MEVCEGSSYFNIKIFDWFGNLLHEISDSGHIDLPFSYGSEKVKEELSRVLEDYRIKQVYRKFTGYQEESMDAEIWVVKNRCQ